MLGSIWWLVNGSVRLCWVSLVSTFFFVLTGRIVLPSSCWKVLAFEGGFPSIWPTSLGMDDLSSDDVVADFRRDVLTKSDKLFADDLFWCLWASFASELIELVEFVTFDICGTALDALCFDSCSSGLGRAAKRCSADPSFPFDCWASEDKVLGRVLEHAAGFFSFNSFGSTFWSEALCSTVVMDNAFSPVDAGFWLAIFILRLDKLDPAARVCRNRLDTRPILLRDDAVRDFGNVIGRPLCLLLSGNVASNANRRFLIARLISWPVIFALRGRW